MPSPTHYGAPVSHGALKDLATNLLSGLRAALLLPRAARHWRPFAAQIVLLMLLDGIVTLAFDVFEADGEGVFNWPGVPRLLLVVPLALGAAWLVSLRTRRDELLIRVATGLVAVTLWFDLGWSALGLAQARNWAPVSEHIANITYALFAWWALALGLCAARIAGTRYPGRLADFGWAIVVLALPFWWVPYQPLWQIEQDPEEVVAEDYVVTHEDVFYGQSELLDETLGRLAPQRRGVEDLYFVGAAGYAAEDVFLNEVGLAADVMRARFDTDHRSVLLANNAKTVHVLPVASATALARALKVVGDTIDPDEDVVFVFLTTHGSEDHQLAMEFWPLQLDSITPAMLKAMLDEAGIKWRVVAISACYSGGFIEPLEDERTLVMTASDADNTSFGCGADSDLTYFGKAYFDEALRGTFSFETAFERARSTIARREQTLALTASNPQLFVGRAIAAKIHRMEGRFARLAAGLPRTVPCHGDAAACGAAVAGAH